MASRRIDAEVAVKVTGQDKVDALEKSLDAISDEKVEVPIEADADAAVKSIDDLLAKVDKLAGEPANLLLTSNAAEITKQIADLVLDIDKLDSTDPTIDAKIENVNQLTGDLEKIQNKAKEINDTKISPQVDTAPARAGVEDLSDSARGANSALANMVGNTGQDLGELAGISGSAGVAIGQMAEYASDARLAGEGMVSALTSMVKVAGPIAALSVAFQAIRGAQEASAESAELAAENVENWTKALEEGGDAAANMNTTLEDQGKIVLDNWKNFDTATKILTSIPLVGWFGKKNQEDITDSIKASGIAMIDYTEAITDRGAAEENVRAAVENSNLSDEQKADVLDYLTQQIDAYNQAQENRAANEKLFAETTASSDAALQNFLNNQDPLRVFQSQWEALINDMADGGITTQGAADAINTLHNELGLTKDQILAIGQGEIDKRLQAVVDAAKEGSQEWEKYQQAVAAAKEAQRQMTYEVIQAQAAVKGGALDVDSMSNALDRLNQSTSELDFSTMAFDTVSSFDDMKEAIKNAKGEADGWASIDLTPDSVEELKGIPEDLMAVTEAIAGMRDPIQTELTHAFDTGGVDAFVEKARFFRREVTQQFTEAFEKAGADSDTAKAKARELADELGLMPKDVRIAIRLTREEEARNALDAFSGVISKMPDEVQVAINTKIAEGDIKGALDILNTQLIKRGYDPIVLPVDADTGPADDKTEGWRRKDHGKATVHTEADDSGAESDTEGWRKKDHGKATVKTDADTAEASKNLLDLISEPRIAKIYAQPNDVMATEIALAALAKLRMAEIRAWANDSQAEADLNYTARTRTSYINQVVSGNPHGQTGHPSTPEGTMLVGEGGPELAYFPQGTQLLPEHETRRVLRDGSGQTLILGAGGGSSTPAPINIGPVQVHLQAGVIGNRYDVARTVVRATKDAIRIAGSRLVTAGN